MSKIYERHREAMAADPENVQAFEALQEHYFLEGNWDELSLLYQRRLEAPSLAADPAARVPVLYRLGQVLEERCDRIDDAEQIYWQVASISPKFRPALRQLRQLYCGRGQLDMVMQIAELEESIEMSATDRSLFLAELGEIWLDHRNDAGEALSCFERALDGDPHQQRALAGAARAQLALGRAEDAARSWTRLIEILRGPERAPALVALGNLYASHLNQLDQATTYFNRAMTDDPRSEAAVEALIIITSSQEKWELVADLYERRFDLASGARHRSAIAVEAGNMHLQRLRNRDTARSWFERARDLVDDDVSVHHAIAELERYEGDDEALRSALDRVVELSDGRAPVSVLLEAADLHTESGQSDRALRYLELAQSRKPDDPLVLEALSDALGEAHRPADRADVLERRAALANDDPQEQAEALCELSRVHEEDLGDPEAALVALERAFDANPQLTDVRVQLQRLYHKTERFDDLLQLLERAMDRGEASERAATGCELGLLLLDQFEDLDRARHAFERALESDPASSQAIQGLERVARASGDDQAVIALCEREASNTTDATRLSELVSELTPLLEASGELDRALHWTNRILSTQPDDHAGLLTAARLQSTLGRRADLVQTLLALDGLLEGPEQAANRRRLSALQSELGDLDAALATMESALSCDPDDVDTLRELVSQYAGANRHHDVATLLRRLVDLLPPLESAACLDELATVLDTNLGDLDGAIVVLFRLIDLLERPAHAPERLEALLERAGRYEDLAQQLSERRRAMIDPSDEADALDLRCAQILMDKLGQLEAAANLFRAVRSHNPACTEATEGLEQALRSGNDSANLAVLLESRAREESDPAARAALEFERAVILEEELGDEERALALYESLADQADDASMACVAGDRIERVLERSGNWTALRARLETRLQEESETNDWEIHQRLVVICRDQLDDRDGCIGHLEAMGSRDPDRAETWRELALLYREGGRDEDWLRVSEAELTTSPDSERELVIRSNATRVCIKLAGSDRSNADDWTATARRHAERVLELSPTHSEASEYLIEHYEASDRPEDVVRLLRARLTDCADMLDADPGARTSLELRLAHWQAERLDDRESAVATLENALRHSPQITSLAEPLVGLYQALGREASVVPLCQHACAACEDNDERIVWKLRLGAALQHCGELRQATETYFEVLRERPDDREIEKTLRGLYRELDDAQPLAALLQSEIPRCPPEQQVDLRVELAALLADRLDRGDEALFHLQAVMQIDADHEGAFDLAIRLSESQDRQEEILILLDARLAGSGTSSQRADWMERRGQLLAGPLSRPEEAATAYRQAIAQDPNRSSARQSLRELMERLGRWSAVLDCLHIEASVADGSERVAILERAVEIAREHLAGDAALPWLERLRAERPDDPNVLARTAELHRQAGRHEALLRSLDAQLALVDDRAGRRDIQVNRARILERDLHSPGRALNAYKIALELTPDSPEVLVELDRLYDLMGRARERVEILEARLAQAPPAERVELHRQAALLSVASLAEPARAVPHLISAYALAGEVERGADATPRLTLLRELAETLRASGRMDAWVRAAEAELVLLDPDRADDLPRCAELHLELADAYGRALGLPDAARRHLQALHALPGDEPPLSADRMERAELDLIEALRAERNHVALAEHLARRLGRADDDVGEWLELARLNAEALHAPAAAANAYREVLARSPHELSAIRGLRHVAECLRDWTEVARTLELELDAQLKPQPSPRERATLQKKLGGVYWHQLDRLDRAAEAYATALETMPEDLETIRCLAPVQELRQEWAAATYLFEHEIELLGDEDTERQSSLWLRVARVCRDELNDTARTLRAYERAAEHGPLVADDQRNLAELYRESGNLERYAESWAVWCDDSDSDACVWDHLALVAAHLELGQRDAALTRATRASEVDPENAEAWERVAELRNALGEQAQARAAFERAAELLEPRPAAQRLVEAASLCTAAESNEAARLLRLAVDRDPALVVAHADLAVLAEACGDLEEAESAAGSALDLLENDQDLPAARQLEIALLGGRCAQERSRLESAARFFAAALERDARCHEALDAQCEVLFAQGELRAACNLADTRIDMPGENPARARQLAISGRGLEDAEDTGAAIARYRQALQADQGVDLAHQGLVRIHETAGQVESAIAALETWIENDGDGASRARSRLRVARHLLAVTAHARAEQHLRTAVEDDSGLAEAWCALVEMLAELGQDDDALAVGEQALDRLETNEPRSRIALATARILEAHAESRRAIDAYAQAVRGDARCVEAARAQARLLRAAGEWHESAAALESFIEAHPDPDSLDLAKVHMERGRLMAGPLEQVEDAIRCYERALELAPDLTEAREPLAALLAHVPERWRDAVTAHSALLAKEPTRTSSMRALLEIGEREDLQQPTRFGLAILRALGATAPDQSASGPYILPHAIGVAPRVDDPVWETARNICRIGSQEIGLALQDGAAAGADEHAGDDGQIPFAIQLDEAEARLTAPGLQRMSVEELSSVILTVSALSADPGGNCNDGPFMHQIDEALGRWSRRKIRKALSPHGVRDIQTIDYGAWRDEVRLDAACLVLDSGNGDLREALLLLSGHSTEESASIPESADISSLVAGSDLARRLLGRVVDAFCARMMSAND